MAEKTTGEASRTLGPVPLWGGWALAVLAWVLHLAISYGLVEWYCHSGTDIASDVIYWALNGITLFAATLALSSLFLSWRNLRRAGSDTARTPEGLERRRFMAIGGVMISLFFVGIILAQGAPNFFLRPCQ